MGHGDEISLIERLGCSAYFLLTAAVSFYVHFNFSRLSAEYGAPLVIAVPVGLALVAIKGGRDLAHRMRR